MINNPGGTEAPYALLRDCSHMDDSVVERLRATVEMSVAWADQALDTLIRLDGDLQGFDALVKQQLYFLRHPERLVSGKAEDGMPDVENLALQTELSLQRLRDGVRDVLMSMQNQDVIGQAVERAASALEKRAAVLEKVVEKPECSLLPTNEIADIHHFYRTEDDLHTVAGSGEDDSDCSLL